MNLEIRTNEISPFCHHLIARRAPGTPIVLGLSSKVDSGARHMDVPQNLGQRIVEAARLAVAAHLHASLDGVHHFRQRVVIGGAGPDFITDDMLPLANRSHRLSEIADGAAE